MGYLPAVRGSSPQTRLQRHVSNRTVEGGVRKASVTERLTMSSEGRSIRAALIAVIPMALILEVSTVSLAGGRPWQVDPAQQFRCGPGIANHPVNVIPTSAVRIPEGWPLSADASITCLTCHTDLSSLVGDLSGSRKGLVQLRDFHGTVDNRIRFCAKCHSDDSTRTASGMHWMAVAFAHIKPDDGQPPKHAGSLDAGSRRCMACHDGVTARESAASNAWNRGPGSVGDHRRNHPVGVPYPQRFSKKGSGPFRPTSLLPPKVRLPGGQVGCISCHDLYAPNPGRLAVPIEGSALCFTCHDMD